MDTAISDEISHFVEEVEAADGAPIDLIELLPKVTANIVTMMLLGTRFDYSDRRLLDLQFGKFAGLNMKSRFVPLIKVSDYPLSCYEGTTPKLIKYHHTRNRAYHTMLN